MTTVILIVLTFVANPKRIAATKVYIRPTTTLKYTTNSIFCDTDRILLGGGPLLTLPPAPVSTQSGGSQPIWQWQCFRLLQTPLRLHFEGSQSYIISAIVPVQYVLRQNFPKPQGVPGLTRPMSVVSVPRCKSTPKHKTPDIRD